MTVVVGQAYRVSFVCTPATQRQWRACVLSRVSVLSCIVDEKPCETDTRPGHTRAAAATPPAPVPEPVQVQPWVRIAALTPALTVRRGRDASALPGPLRLTATHRVKLVCGPGNPTRANGARRAPHGAISTHATVPRYS